jgi:hypothetical protein
MLDTILILWGVWAIVSDWREMKNKIDNLNHDD